MAYTTIKKSTDYFNTKLYTGNNSTNAITGVGFQPDWTWIKSTDGTYNNQTFDSVRGATKSLVTNEAAAEITISGLTAFGTDGFTLGSDAQCNSGGPFVSWNWLGANGTSANTDGSISSTVSANTTSGFSIVSYTGTGANATVGHGLGVAPKMIIIRRLNVIASWRIFHQAIGNTKNLRLNSTGAEQTSSTMWNNTSPTSTTFSLGSYDEVNGSSAPHIAYCFAEKTGYSKFGSYVGNGQADGTFVYTGFKPAFVMIKASSATENWQMYDNKRLGYNVDNNMLRANLDSAQQTDDDIDILSNGFKLRRNSGAFNTSGSTYIFMAFAEEPLVANSGTNGVPATAR